MTTTLNTTLIPIGGEWHNKSYIKEIPESISLDYLTIDPHDICAAVLDVASQKSFNLVYANYVFYDSDDAPLTSILVTEESELDEIEKRSDNDLVFIALAFLYDNEKEMVVQIDLYNGTASFIARTEKDIRSFVDSVSKSQESSDNLQYSVDMTKDLLVPYAWEDIQLLGPTVIPPDVPALICTCSDLYTLCLNITTLNKRGELYIDSVGLALKKSQKHKKLIKEALNGEYIPLEEVFNKNLYENVEYTLLTKDFEPIYIQFDDESNDVAILASSVEDSLLIASMINTNEVDPELINRIAVEFIDSDEEDSRNLN